MAQSLLLKCLSGHALPAELLLKNCIMILTKKYYSINQLWANKEPESSYLEADFLVVHFYQEGKKKKAIALLHKHSLQTVMC